RGRRQACVHSGVDCDCCRHHQAGGCCCCSGSARIQADPSRRDDDSRQQHPFDGNCEQRGRTAAEVTPSRQAPLTPNAALAFTGATTPPMVALRGGYRDRRGGG
ncbi:unnamed protein product, partial [Laminaria digitata]